MVAAPAPGPLRRRRGHLRQYLQPLSLRGPGLAHSRRRARAHPPIVRRDSQGAECQGGYGALLVERARLHIALQEWEQAEKDLDELFRLLPDGKMSYYTLAAACIVKGFLRERRRDSAGAQEFWQRGL